MKLHWYFESVAWPKRPYIERAWIGAVLAAPERVEVQPDGRIRYWGEVLFPGETEPRMLRVVTLADGETVLNVFPDGSFRKAPR